MTDATKEKRKTIRFSDQQIEKINEICKNNNCSQSQVVKSALDLATKGNSDIDFSENYLDFVSDEARLGLQNNLWEIAKIGEKKYKIRKKSKSIMNDLPLEIKEGLKNGNFEVTKTELGNFKISPKIKKPKIVCIQEPKIRKDNVVNPNNLVVNELKNIFPGFDFKS